MGLTVAMSAEDQRARLDALAKLNELDMQKFPGNTELAARISSYELAYRMQGCAPDAVDLKSESEATKKLYGLDSKLGLDHTKLTYRFNGRDMRLTDVYGTLVPQIVGA